MQLGYFRRMCNSLKKEFLTTSAFSILRTTSFIKKKKKRLFLHNFIEFVLLKL